MYRNLKGLMAKHGITQKALAEYLGISQATMIRYLKHPTKTTDFTVTQAKKVQKLFCEEEKITLDEIFYN